MKRNSIILIAIMLVSAVFANAQSGELQEAVAFIKQNLASSKENIRKYEWIETTTIFVDGEQNSVKQNQCYFSVDGSLTKVATGATQEAKRPGGLRGVAADNKKEKMTDYVQTALAKIKGYIPPQPDKIQKIFSDGKAEIQILEPGKKFKLDFPDYAEAGDKLSISLDKANKVLLNYTVSTFVEGPKDPVSLTITFKTLPDGTSYPGDIVFESASKKVKIEIKNSGFKVAASK